jgi:hypothetical protein
MGFLDNSGDIILDAVLTDTGRMRLAKGDGSFKITKFAFGDDEINYNLYDKNHPSGNAYYDIEILQTPVLEAFTNNASSMKSKLISIPRTNLLYLPVLKLQTTDADTSKDTLGTGVGSFLVSVDSDTNDEPTSENLQVSTYNGVLNGLGGGNSYIEVHQGLDTTDISSTFTLDPDLVENQYIIEIDNRLGMITQPQSTTTAPVSYIDDDNMASYFVSSGTSLVVTNPGAGTEVPAGTKSKDGTTLSGIGSTQAIAGPRGTVLAFGIKASLDLNSSTTLFTKFGSTYTTLGDTYYYIDSTVRVTGATTGYRLDIPVRFIKLVN